MARAPLGDSSTRSVVSWIHTLYIYLLVKLESRVKGQRMLFSVQIVKATEAL